MSWESAADGQSPAVKPSWHTRPDLVDPPADFRIVVDTREQLPYFVGRRWVTGGTLRSGDYSLLGYEHRIAIERKSLADAYGTFGRGRARFERELERLRLLDRAAILIEATYRHLLDPTILDPFWRSQVSPASVEGSLFTWGHRYGVEVLYAGGRMEGERMAFRWLATWWRDAQKRGLLTDEL